MLMVQVIRERESEAIGESSLRQKHLPLTSSGRRVARAAFFQQRRYLRAHQVPWEIKPAAVRDECKMPVLVFTLVPAGVGQLSDLLTCLAKFDENVSLEATPQNVRKVCSH